MLSNSTPIGGIEKIVEVDEAKFGKRKFNVSTEVRTEKESGC